jgi:uncharacterized protein (TIGR03083 family)
MMVMAESERLIQYLATLSPEAWRTPSACVRWEVRDVVAPLVHQGEFYADAVMRSVQGDPSPPSGRPAPGSVHAAADAERIAQRTITRRQELGDQVLDAFRTTNDRLKRLLTSLGPQDWEKPLYSVSLGIAPMRFRPAIWLSALVLHGWDIRSRLLPDAPLTAESLSVLVDLIVGPLLAPPSWLCVPGPGCPCPMRRCSHGAVFWSAMRGMASWRKPCMTACPWVLVPWSRDQPGVEARAAALGVAEVIAKQERTALRLAAAIDRV